MQQLLLHFPVGAPALMASFLAMSGAAMLVSALATWFFASSLSVAGTSLAINAGRALVAFFLNKVWMIALLPMLALYNGIGGGAASVIAAAHMLANRFSGGTQLVETLIVALVGAATLSGSVIAGAKLNGFIKEPPQTRGGWLTLSPAIAVAILAIGGYIGLSMDGDAARPVVSPGLIYLLLACALVFGALITLRFRRAQMPVLISLYNALTGLAIGLEGFILGSPVLLIVGIAIGSARTFVTLLMVEYSPGHEPWRAFWRAAPRQRTTS